MCGNTFTLAAFSAWRAFTIPICKVMHLRPRGELDKKETTVGEPSVGQEGSSSVSFNPDSVRSDPTSQRREPRLWEEIGLARGSAEVKGGGRHRSSTHGTLCFHIYALFHHQTHTKEICKASILFLFFRCVNQGSESQGGLSQGQWGWNQASLAVGEAFLPSWPSS